MRKLYQLVSRSMLKETGASELLTSSNTLNYQDPFGLWCDVLKKIILQPYGDIVPQTKAKSLV